MNEASASEATCTETTMGSDGRAGLTNCLLKEACIAGMHHPPRTVSLSDEGMAAYRAAGIDATTRYYKLEVRLRKRAGSTTGQCGYQSPTRFMFSLIELTEPTVLTVIFDPDWVY